MSDSQSIVGHKIKGIRESKNLTIEEIEKLKGRNHSWWADVERILKAGVTARDTQSSMAMFCISTHILRGLPKEPFQMVT